MGALRVLRSAFRLSVKSALVLLVAGMLALNVAALTIGPVNAVLSGLLSAAGLPTVAAQRDRAERRAVLKAEREAAEKALREAGRRTAREAAGRAARRQAARRISRQIAGAITGRVQRQAVRNSASVFGEAVPFVGVAVLAGAVAMEIEDSCNTARDMAGLTAALEAEGDPQAAQQQARDNFNCRAFPGDAFDPPTSEEIWAAVRESPGKAWESARGVYRDLPEVSFSGACDRVIASGARLLETLGLGGDDDA